MVQFTYTGAPQSYVVPGGVTAVKVDLYGAQGGSPEVPLGGGGLGGRVETTIAVTPGETLHVYVGGAGKSKPAYGGGGGGGTDIRRGGQTYADRVVVAGGGGGNGGIDGALLASPQGRGGAGGGLVGVKGTTSTYAGEPGTQTAGGTGWATTDGSFGLGGGYGGAGAELGGYNGGGGGGSQGATSPVRNYAGGGGGYYGGGGATGTSATNFGGGGGGSGYFGDNTGVLTTGVRAGDGMAIIEPASLVRFDYTGAEQPWVVPPGVTSVMLDVTGAEGGNPLQALGGGGRGGSARGTLAVTPGETLYINVGGRGAGLQGAGGGAGGGGATDIRRGGRALTDRVIVGGGGGASSTTPSAAALGGVGGGSDGAAGSTLSTNLTGKGGTQTAGGASGGGTATAGALGQGGVAASGTGFGAGWNGGGSGGFITANSKAVGGGGGGFYGGGGASASTASANTSQASGGGGGSGYVGTLVNPVLTSGVVGQSRSGDGLATITAAAPAAPAQTVPLGQAQVAETAGTFTSRQKTLLGQAQVVETAVALTSAQATRLGQAQDLETAVALTPLFSKQQLGQASEDGAALPLVVIGTGVRVTLGQATEVDAAGRTNIVVTLAPATHTDQAGAVTPLPQGLARLLGEAHETDVAGVIGEVRRGIGQSSRIELRTTSAYPGASSPLVLQVLDPDLHRSPTVVTVVVADSNAAATLTFRVDGEIVYVDAADSEGGLMPTSIPLLTQLAGPHQITVQDGVHTASASFTLRQDPPQAARAAGLDADPVQVPGTVDADGVRRWVLQDLMPGGIGSYVMPINPTRRSGPLFERSLATGHATARRGAHALTGGTPTVLQWALEGFVNDASMARALEDYADIERRFWLIDDRNRAWRVAVENFELVPRKRQLEADGGYNDWYGDYKMSVAVFSDQPKTPVVNDG